MLTQAQKIKTYSALIELAEMLAPELKDEVAAALAIAQDLVTAGHADTVGMLRVLREKTKNEWQAAIDVRFGAGGNDG